MKYALRQLTKNPGFTAVIVLTLALGIGACTAVFSVVNGVILKPLPYPSAERIMTLGETDDPQNRPVGGSVSPVNFEDWRKQSTVFEHLAAFRGGGFNLTGLGDAQRVSGLRVNASFFKVLGVAPASGRDFTAGDDQPVRKVVITSHQFWQRQLGGRPDAVGSEIALNGEPHTVIGVMPEWMRRATAMDLWVPLAMTPDETAPENRGSHYINVIGRLKPGVTVEQARSEMDLIAKRLEEQFPATNKNSRVSVIPQLEFVTGPTRPVLLALLGAVGALLLIACANVANLLLARATARLRDISVRAALGASRGRIMRQLLLESLVLAALGGAGGVLLALWGLDALLALAPNALPRTQEIALDWSVLGFATLLVLCTGLGFGLVPALQASRVDLVSALNDGARGSGESGSRGRVRNALVVAEIALALVLLTTSGLLMRSFARLQAVDPGFNADRAVMLTINPPLAKYRNKQQHLDLADTFLRKLSALPGVTHVGGTATLPFSGSENAFTFAIQGRPAFPVGESPSATYGQVTAGYFAAMGIPVIRGREFDARDGATAPRVVLVSQAFARRFFPNEDPIGRRIEIENGDTASREIVGIVGDVKHNQLTDEQVMQFYEPFTQSTSGSLTYVVRTANPDPALPAALRAVVREVDVDLAVVRLAPISDLIAESVARQKFGMTLFGVFSSLALILAAIGIYGVMAYTVSRRTAEFGLRMALGAQVSDVRALVLKQAARLTAWGLGMGLVLAVVGGRVLDALLYNTSSREPLILGGIAALLALVALVACWLPAWRASRVNPLVALRSE